MHEMKEKLIKAGTDILNASKTELYVSMRFLDIALNSLGYEMDLSMKTIGTDSQKIRFNPRYLIENYQNDSVLVNRAYLHMLLHCVFRHMFHNRDKDEDVWNLSCDIAVTAIIDQMNYRCIRLVVPDERQAMYDRLKSEMKVLTAEGIYKSLTKRPLTWLEMEAAKKQFVVDDHVFWDSEQEDQKDGDGRNDQNQNNEDNQDDENNDQNNQNNDRQKEQKEQERKEQGDTYNCTGNVNITPAHTGEAIFESSAKVTTKSVTAEQIYPIMIPATRRVAMCLILLEFKRINPMEIKEPIKAAMIKV